MSEKKETNLLAEMLIGLMFAPYEQQQMYENKLYKERVKGNLNRTAQIAIELLAWHMNQTGVPKEVNPFCLSKLEDIAKGIEIYEKADGKISIVNPSDPELEEVMKEAIRIVKELRSPC